ncbi:RidA family protein [Naasia sp. SYSU D00948]|uniref:RidA family protein n=1 Tax=Naasia sp. SYSU D00948 TaxID=2817379 RepID=UPI001B3067BC|nr:RidA family protein [Naasia sp. SYSU D00948]
MPVTHVNPKSLPSNPAFSHATIAEAGRTLYIGGQNGTTSDGSIPADPAEQTRLALRNLLAILEEAGATQADVAKLTIVVVDTVDIQAGFAASREVWGDVPTAITVLRVSGLARPDALVEIEAIASLPPAT